jgi:uncharacterized protein (TIRG00374 family)
LRGKLMIGIGLGAFVYLALIIYSDWDRTSAAFAKFNWLWFPVILALTFTNYLFRFLKWDSYLRRLDIRIKKTDSMIIFLSGLVGTITPGKIGELLKALLLKKIKGTPMSTSAPVIVAERLTDFIALLIISLAGVMVFAVGQNIWVLVAVAAVLVSFIGAISNRTLCMWMIDLSEKLPVIGKMAGKLREAYESTYVCFRLAPLSIATFWSLCAWMCECIGFWLVLKILGVQAQLLTASFIYAFGTIVGVVSPGGLGVMDGSMVGMLQLTGLMGAAATGKGVATAATIIIRIATLWFAVLVGVVTLLLFQKRFEGVSEMLDETPQD